MEPKRKRVEGTDSRSNSTPGFKSQGCHSLPMQPEATDFNSELKNWDHSKDINCHYLLSFNLYGGLTGMIRQD